MKRLFVFLILAAFTTWRDAYRRRNPKVVAHAVRWTMLSTLFVALYWFLLLPLTVMLSVIHHAPHDAVGDVIHLGETMRMLLLGTMGLMIAGSSLLSGYAKTVMADFADHRWTLLVFATMGGGFLLYIGYVVTMATSLLDLSKGDNGLLAAFMVAWAWSITRVCNAPVDQARDSWKLDGTAVARR